jgi:SNF2 family DNA or RNA helicase
MDRYQREEVVKKFTDQKDTNPMILCATLGAGSCGLNLTPCSTVYLADIAINPFDQLQAINRVHRITQTNQVNVTKFCMQNMIEENILNSHLNKFSEAKSNGLIMV